MTTERRLIALATASLLWQASVLVGADPLGCAALSDGLDDIESIHENGGDVSGYISFRDSDVCGQAVVFNGAASVRYPGQVFDAAEGSISFWVQIDGGDPGGGLVQIGEVGQPNSIGVFYNFTDDLFLEVRNDSSYYQIRVDDVISEAFTHVTFTWDLGRRVYKVFVNGVFARGLRAPSPVEFDNGFLEIGRTGWYQNMVGALDELRFFDRALSDAEIYAEFVHSDRRYAREPSGKPVSTGNVQLIGGCLHVDGRPFTIKGVGYQPVPVGAENTPAVREQVYGDPAIRARDLPLLRGMHANTVRFWGELAPSGVPLLDDLYNDGVDPIYALMAIEVPLDVDYGDPAVVEQLEDHVREYVNRFKDHPAVLGWLIGNENNLHYAGDVRDWFSLANRLARAAYESEGEAYHPTIIVNASMLHCADAALGADDVSLEFVDMWGHNSYVGREFACYFDYYDAMTAKPLVLTEFGIDAFDHAHQQEHQEVHADWVTHLWCQIASRTAGGTLMAYSDEWWKAGVPARHDNGGYSTDTHPDGFANEEWWGIMAIEDAGAEPDTLHSRQAYFAIADRFAESGSCCPADLTGDGEVGFTDVIALLAAWGTADCRADLDRDGDVGFEDLILLLAAWGPCPG